MKIGDIVQFYSPLSGGVKRYIHEKMRGFAERDDIDHFVIVPSHREALTVERRTRVYEVPCPALIGSQSYRVLLSEKHIRRIVAAEAPDVLEVGDPYRAAWIALRIARERRIPVVAYYHSDYPRALGRTVAKHAGQSAARLVDRLVRPYLLNLYRHMSVTVVATDRFGALLRDVGIPRVAKVPLGTDTEMFRPRLSRPFVFRELDVPPGTRLLMYAGRLAREKNIRNLLSMMECFSPADRTHLLIVGDGESRGLVRSVCASRRDVTWLPYCENAGRLADLYAAADVFVHPSTSETFGLVSIEAQACGTPVVAVRGGGVDETIEQGVSGILAEGADPRLLAAAVREALLLDTNGAARQARHARIKADFSSAAMCAQLRALYRSLCNETAAACVDVPETGDACELHCAPLHS